MSISYIERLRESFVKDAAYMMGTYGAYHGIMDGIRKLSDFFYALDKDGGITCYEEHTGNAERRFGIQTESLHLSVFCSAESYPAFSMHARIYRKGRLDEHAHTFKSDHVLETSDADALISYLYFIIGSVDPEKGKWIRLK